MQVRNQAYLRRRNKEDIINLLRQKSRSYSEIARVLKLSNTAIANIADDLIEDDIICRNGDTKGRTGIELSINGEYGYIDDTGKIVIDFQFDKASLFFADGYALVKMGSKYGVIDENGKYVIPPTLDGVETTRESDGFAT